MIDLAVIMAVYHKDKIEYLREAVESIQSQSYLTFDFYILFDGPVAKEIDHFLTAISYSDPRIKLYKKDVNEGLAKALNFLLIIVMGNSDYKYIARMDADDISDPDRFRKQREYLLANIEISCVGSWYQVIDESGKSLSYRKMPVSHEDIHRSYCFRTPVAHPSVMFRRNLIEIAGYYPGDTVLMEDTVLWAIALMHGLRFANLPEFLYKFRMDVEFYVRRSGIRYGWNYIKTRFAINKSMKLPAYCYFCSILIGVLKMMPSFIIRFFYNIDRKLDNNALINYR
jgi:glycosyltransferase involved in cell wall biosynthesis